MTTDFYKIYLTIGADLFFLKNSWVIVRNIVHIAQIVRSHNKCEGIV